MNTSSIAKIAIASLLGLSSCGKDKKKESAESIADIPGMGCAQGVLVDGVNGNRVAIPDDNDQGVFALVRNKLIRAVPLVKDPDSENANKNLMGEYYLCGLPLEQNFPLFAWVDGFQEFEGEIGVASTFAQRTRTSDQEDHKFKYPTRQANIAIFPEGVEVRDLKLHVAHKGEAVKDARVILSRTAANSLNRDIVLNGAGANFVSPKSYRLGSFEMMTDENGDAIFSGEELTLGAEYVYRVVPTVTDEISNDLMKTGKVTIGLSQRNGSNLLHIPYLVNVNLDDADLSVEVLASTPELVSFSKNGVIVIKFNQDIEIVKNTEDNLIASLQNAGKTKLVENTASNGKSEQVKITVTGSTLTLTPQFEVGPDAKATDALILIHGLYVRPIGSVSPNSQAKVSQSHLSIRLFDGLTTAE